MDTAASATRETRFKTLFEGSCLFSAEFFFLAKLRVYGMKKEIEPLPVPSSYSIRQGKEKKSPRLKIALAKKEKKGLLFLFKLLLFAHWPAFCWRSRAEG